MTPAIWQEIVAAVDAVGLGLPGSRIVNPRYEVFKAEDGTIVITLPGTAEVLNVVATVVPREEPAADAHGRAAGKLAR